MLRDSPSPSGSCETLLPDALAHAVKICNRMPKKALQWQSPFEVVTKGRNQIFTFRIFGCYVTAKDTLFLAGHITAGEKLKFLGDLRSKIVVWTLKTHTLALQTFEGRSMSCHHILGRKSGSLSIMFCYVVEQEIYLSNLNKKEEVPIG